MLKHLLIKNYALIEHLEIHPSPSFNIVTGETGAGKSIMLGAIGLLLGNRADTKVLYDDSQKCIIEGEFQLTGYQIDTLFHELELEYDELTVLRREIAPSGKSRAFINDSPVTLDVMRQVTARLMDIHSQHDTLELGANDYQLNILDAYAGTKTQKIAYQAAFSEFRQAERAYQKLLQENKEMKSTLEFNQYQLEELEKAQLDEIDQQALEEELQVLENAEAIKASLNASLEVLSGGEFSVGSGLKTALQQFNGISKFSHLYEELRERLKSAQIEISDIVLEIEREESNLFFDPQRIEFVKDRLDQVYTLQNKHQLESVAALLALRAQLREKVERVLNFDEELQSLEKQKNQALQHAVAAGQALSAARLAKMDALAEEMRQLLVQLGMPDSKIQLLREEIAPEATGIDRLTFLFSANKGIAPEPLDQVASGGEFSRLMLVIKYILAQKTQLPTIIFDEIDTGVSGEIAIKMGRMMQEMARKHQVISISHLPQIAAKADKHYFVYKDNSAARTVSRIRELSQADRVEQIAQMIGGANPSPVAYDSARELMGA